MNDLFYLRTWKALHKLKRCNGNFLALAIWAIFGITSKGRHGLDWTARLAWLINVFHLVASLADLAKIPSLTFFAAEFLAFSLCDEMRTGLAGSGWGWCQDFYCKRWFADFTRPQDYWMKRIIPLITSSNIGCIELWVISRWQKDANQLTHSQFHWKSVLLLP